MTKKYYIRFTYRHAFHDLPRKPGHRSHPFYYKMVQKKKHK